MDKISAVDYLDDDPNEPYQFMMTVEGKRHWKLKANSEARILLVACMFVIGI